MAQGLMEYHFGKVDKPDTLFVRRLIEHGARPSQEMLVKLTGSPPDIRNLFHNMDSLLLQTLYLDFVSELPTVTPFNPMPAYFNSAFRAFFLGGFKPNDQEVCLAIQHGSPLVLETIYEYGTKVSQIQLYQTITSRAYWAIEVMLHHGLHPSTKVRLAHPHSR